MTAPCFSLTHTCVEERKRVSFAVFPRIHNPSELPLTLSSPSSSSSSSSSSPPRLIIEAARRARKRRNDDAVSAAILERRWRLRSSVRDRADHAAQSPLDPNREVVTPRPDVIHTGVSIFHPQLRDLLQPAGEKGKVLFVHRNGIECADFNTLKAPTHFCTLDFAAVCLTTGAGLVAAGGEHAELDIRPLFPLPGAPATQQYQSSFQQSRTGGEGDGASTAATGSRTPGSMGSTATTSAARMPPRWHLRTPTGGSINNSICIQSDSAGPSKALRGIVPNAAFDGETSSHAGIPKEWLASADIRHREKRRKEDEGEANLLGALTWRRDEPRIWPEHTTNARGDKSPGRHTKHQASLQSSKQHDESNSKPLAQSKATKTVRVLISNNDRSVKAFRLRPPIRQRNGAASGSQASQSERIETGLPGLSRMQNVDLPTCINHSSFSPDGKHVVSVGDTNEVFLFSVNQETGQLTKVASYTASQDAAFSTTWSPDSMQFAVASQDGYVSVWHVRSSERIAYLKTSQTTDLYNPGAGAARVVKWSPRGDILAFSEQQNYVHLVDTTNFEIVQRLRIPALGMTSAGATSNGLQCLSASERQAANLGHDEPTSGTLEPGYSMPDLHRRTIRNEEDLLDLTSPLRSSFASRERRSAFVSQLSRPWPSNRRYHDIGSVLHSRAPLDRTLLGDWATTRRSSADMELSRRIVSSAELSARLAARHASSAQQPFAGSSASSPSTPQTTSAARSITLPTVSGAGGSTSTSETSQFSTTDFDQMLFQDQSRLSSLLASANAARSPSDTAAASPSIRSVDSILAGLGDAADLSSAAWSLEPGLFRPIRRPDPSNVEISGLTWDPEGDYLYVSTSDLVARYTVCDLRRSFGQASLL